MMIMVVMNCFNEIVELRRGGDRISERKPQHCDSPKPGDQNQTRIFEIAIRSANTTPWPDIFHGN